MAFVYRDPFAELQGELERMLAGAFGPAGGGLYPPVNVFDRGEAYVVFGGSGLAGGTVTLNALGAGGFTLRGFEDNALAGVSVSGAGDVNGDGFADFIVGCDQCPAQPRRNTEHRQ